MDLIENYTRFLQSKIKIDSDHGFIVNREDMRLDALKPHCVDIVEWACRKGKCLIAASFGLHKTRINIEVMRQIHKRNPNAPVLVICPLGVKHQFQYEDGPAMDVDFQYIRNRNEQHLATSDFHITNYERVRDGDLDLAIYQAVALDEGSCLRSLGSDTTQEFIKKFKFTQYKFVYTATPAPNEFLEIINYSEFLGVMDRGQALTRFFQRDSQKAGNLTLHPAHEEAFWLFVSSWATFLTMPSDLGYSDDGYDLPPIDVQWHMVDSDQSKFGVLKERDGQVKAFADSANSLPEAAKVKRASIDERLLKALEIIQERIIFSSNENYLTKQQGSQEDLHERLFKDPQEETGNGRAKGNKKSKKKREVRDGSGIQNEEPNRREEMGKAESGKENESEIESGIWSDSRGFQRETDSAELQVCDLWEGESINGEGSDVCGSLPSEGPDKGITVSELQLRIRSLQEQYQYFIQCNGIPEQFITFCLLNSEQELTEKIFHQIGIPTSSLSGKEDIPKRESGLYDWKEKRTTAFLSKPVISGCGLNLQQCHEMIFMSIDYKFNDFIQACHRIYRFGQKHQVNIHIIYSREEQEVVNSLKRKWKQHDLMQAKMRAIIKEYGLNHSQAINKLTRTFGMERVQVSGKDFTAINNDSVIELENNIDGIATESVGLIHTSIPFGNHYEYSASYNDLGHNSTNEEFWKQMDFLIPNLFRTLKPGRNAIIHVKDRIRYNTMTGLGSYTIDPFSDECTAAFKKHGFLFIGRITIVTDVVRENNQTYRLGWTEKCKDGSKMGCGLPEYLLLFRKPQTDLSKGFADEPVLLDKQKFTLPQWQIIASSFWRSSGNRHISPQDLATWNADKVYKWFRAWSLNEIYDYNFQIEAGEALAEKDKLSKTYASIAPESPNDNVWTGINSMMGLNAEQQKSKTEKHICPLPFDIVERVIDSWSMEGDTVLDPFGGLMTVPLIAIRKKRKGIGIELNKDYFKCGAKYLQLEEQKQNIPTLFDVLEEEKKEEAA